jgi:hypothetical protein
MPVSIVGFTTWIALKSFTLCPALAHGRQFKLLIDIKIVILRRPTLPSTRCESLPMNDIQGVTSEH